MEGEILKIQIQSLLSIFFSSVYLDSPSHRSNIASWVTTTCTRSGPLHHLRLVSIWNLRQQRSFSTRWSPPISKRRSCYHATSSPISTEPSALNQAIWRFQSSVMNAATNSWFQPPNSVLSVACVELKQPNQTDLNHIFIGWLKIWISARTTWILVESF